MKKRTNPKRKTKLSGCCHSRKTVKKAKKRFAKQLLGARDTNKYPYKSPPCSFATALLYYSKGELRHG